MQAVVSFSGAFMFFAFTLSACIVAKSMKTRPNEFSYEKSLILIQEKLMLFAKKLVMMIIDPSAECGDEEISCDKVDKITSGLTTNECESVMMFGL